MANVAHAILAAGRKSIMPMIVATTTMLSIEISLGRMLLLLLLLLLLLFSVELLLHEALEFRQLVLSCNAAAAASAIDARVIIIVEWIIMEITHVCWIVCSIFYDVLEVPGRNVGHGLDNERWSALQKLIARFAKRS